MKYLSKEELESSDIVANCNMNRERKAFGSNSYSKDLQFDILDYVLSCLKEKQEFLWLDICCGQGNALIQIAEELVSQNLDTDLIDLTGIDLIPFFYKSNIDYSFLNFLNMSIFNYNTDKKFDLISCVHGMHYMGDKLKLIEMTASMLKESGLFIANFDTHDMVDEQGKSLSRPINKFLKDCGLHYNSKNKIIINRGIQNIVSSFTFLGANDKSIVNYTGQKTVQSVYSK